MGLKLASMSCCYASAVKHDEEGQRLRGVLVSIRQEDGVGDRIRDQVGFDVGEEPCPRRHAGPIEKAISNKPRRDLAWSTWQA